MTKRIMTTLLALGIIISPLSALAAPGTWKAEIRNEDDTEYINMILPTHSTSTPVLLGAKQGETNPVWMKFAPYFHFDQVETNLMEVTLDAGALDDFANIYALFDAFELKKVSTSTLATAIAPLTGIQSTMAEITANLTGTSTTMGISTLTNNEGLMSRADKTKLDAMTGSQVQVDWNQASTTAVDYVKNKPTVGKSYEGTTLRTGSFPIFKSATVASGVAVFNLTSDGTSGGSTLCPNGVIQDSVNAFVSDATASYQMAYAFSNSNKTVTVTTNKLTTANILTGILGQTTGNGSAVKLSVWCY